MDNIKLNELKLKDLQPSQFYISEKKLRDIESWLNPVDLSCFEPIPLKLLDGRPVMTDGHTRAVAALRAGLDSVPLVWDEDELSWDNQAGHADTTSNIIQFRYKSRHGAPSLRRVPQKASFFLW